MIRFLRHIFRRQDKFLPLRDYLVKWSRKTIAMTVKTFKIVLIFLILSPALWGQQKSDKAKTVPLLFQMLDTYHYKPPTRNFLLSNQIFDRLMKTIDPYGLFFTEATVGSLKLYRDSLCSDNPILISAFVTGLTEKYMQ